MDKRETFLQAVFASTIERIQVMTEAQVLDQLRVLKTARENDNETLAFLKSISLPVSDTDDAIIKLSSVLSSVSRRGDNVLPLSDYIESVLQKRLETLRKKGN